MSFFYGEAVDASLKERKIDATDKKHCLQAFHKIANLYTVNICVM